MSAEPAVNANAGESRRDRREACGSARWPDSSDLKLIRLMRKRKRGSHRVMAASGRVPNRLVFGGRSSKMEASTRTAVPSVSPR